MQDTVNATSPVERSTVQAIARAAAVLRALEGDPTGMTLAELSTAVELPKSTVHRIVAALTGEGLVASAAGRLRLGSALARLGAATRVALPAALAPLLADLSAELDETVDLAVLDGARARFVDQVAADRRLRAVSAVGERFPLHCTANGKVLLAAMSDADIAALLPARLPRHTRATITTRAALLRELAVVRAAGFAIDREEHTDGIAAVGVAARDPAGVAAAISIPVPAARFAVGERRIVAAAVAAGARATALLGG